MELEDELDRLRMEFPQNPADFSQRRSSDYFSDSGASSSRYPISDLDVKLEQVEKQLRKVEQEKANLKVETAKRLQTELGRRRDLEELVRDLEDQLDKKDEETDRTPAEKVDELTASLEEARRRLSQEKMTKENVEDLYSATKEELERVRNEADNLRDEVVPQLKARVEGLEGQAGDAQGLIYENARLQQELAALRESLGNNSHFYDIQEEGGVASAIGHRMSLHKSPLPMRSSSLRRAGSIREGGRDRSGSIGQSTVPEAVKEVEDQRDALHKALRLMIARHEKQNRDHERAIRKLTLAKTRAEQISPKRTAYTREVAFLKEEVTTLRKRTEDALEQKWQYEKSLSGLKMDLDRAEQETRGLRIILQENDFSASSTSTTEKDEQLKLSISRAESERDHARKVAQTYRERAASAPEGSESATEFLECAERMDELAQQLESQVQSHKNLRARLSAAVAKGEKEQHESTRQIEEMQKRLAGMEDSVLAAQQHSETTLACHDAEVRRIEDASSPQLSRLNVAFPSPARLGIPPSPLLRTKSPKLLGGKMVDTSLLEMSRTQMLERKVKELEGLLREAEEDVKMVVQRVNRSQMEVADLQMERDEALNSMRKLQARMVEERERAEVLMKQ
jgi:chromosome segregation ATPase